MALKKLAVLGMTLEVTELSDPNIQANIVISGIPSGVYLCETIKGVYLDGLQVTVTNITAPNPTPPPPGATIADPGPYIVSLNASTNINFEKTNNKVLREDDLSDIINATPQIPSTPNNIPYPVTFKIKISDAGQNVVLGE